ncbi:hypothetical protein [Streptomyces sp. NPDC057689]|uniref:hypothetical protein n=1 Tax=Streptomyces sp. NPDC057689 TaxID=3346213 RepID=UPI0036B3B6AE
MTDSKITIRAVPGPTFLARLTVATWLDPHTLDFPIGHLLICHAPPCGAETQATIEDGLLGMIGAMGLLPAAEPMPALGPRLITRGPFVVIDYGHPTAYLTVPTPGDQWRQHAAAGGHVCISVLLDTLPPGAGPDAVDAHLARSFANGRAYVGTTTVRNP